MDGEQRMFCWLTALIAGAIVAVWLGTVYLYHWKKVTMAKAGYEEVVLAKPGSSDLAWQKSK